MARRERDDFTAIGLVTGPFPNERAPPPRVGQLRERILEACASGDIEALRVPLQWSETPPVLARKRGAGGAPDPIAFLKSRSFDGRGMEMLRIIAAIFSAPYARLSRGPFITFIWPALALIPAGSGDPDAVALSWRASRFADVMAPDAPRMHRAVIGEDGTWHSLLDEA